MRITCFYGDHSDMGYIYLTPPIHEDKTAYWSRNEISQYVSEEKLSIPYVTDLDVTPTLIQMPVSENTFKADHGKSYDTEYGNDMDKLGYIIGIELTLAKNNFVDLVSNQAFKVIRTDWSGQEFHLITFDHLENVLHPENILYKLIDKEDAFVIIQLKKPEDLGIRYFHEEDIQPIALFKGLLSAREDIYPVEYLIKPEFFMCQDSSSLL
ncbi:hypothetical protein [Paenibacillus odorifer]|uniref:hypothetical protein n=1 Tax=Paenibacillus TaxID=44249 RepID=UPI00096C121E|nr:hypothetical protein [Paenibacillus odorifer]OME26359.1 hypothetical protein BSK57_08685 [Paenibacillus odorifer]OME35791.1 hypothetical protein BSK63_05560 [Paenibacillus odorifer]OME40709.1 hypothetical protein BSK46_06745 [Paenibacillus odorifer]